MAKRFTDSDKWKDPWFDNLSGTAKLFFYYLCDMVDCAGVWKTNFKNFEKNTGFKYSVKEFEKDFEGKVALLKNGNYLLLNFIRFQYGTLGKNANILKGVLKSLKYNDIEIKGYPIIEQALPKDKEGIKDKDQELDKDNNKSKLNNLLEDKISDNGFTWSDFLEKYDKLCNKDFAKGRFKPYRGMTPPSLLMQAFVDFRRELISLNMTLDDYFTKVCEAEWYILEAKNLITVNTLLDKNKMTKFILGDYSNKEIQVDDSEIFQ